MVSVFWRLLMYSHSEVEISRHGQVEVMVRAARLTGADVVTCVNHFLPSAADAPTDTTVPHGSFIPLGGAAAAGMFENSFGDANALLRRSLLDEAPLVRARRFAGAGGARRRPPSQPHGPDVRQHT